MLFDFFELVLHLYHENLDVALVGLRAHRIDFAPHLLSDETEFAPGRLLVGSHFAEIAAVVLQAYLLLGDVELFEVEDHLLFQPVRIDLDVELRQILADAGLDRLSARLFVGDYLLLVAFDLVHAPQQVGDQRGALLQAEVVEPGDGLPRRRQQRGMFLFGYRFVRRRNHVGHSQHRLHHGVERGLHTCIGERIAQLADVGAELLLIYMGRSLDGRTLGRDENFDLAALQRLCRQRADFGFERTVCRGHFDAQVELFGVERADFDAEFLIRGEPFGLAETGHGSDHWSR